MTKNNKTSEGLKALLKRNGVEPTGDWRKDVELARQFMPPKLTGRSC